MIKIVNIGMNHETAPVALRECLAQEPSNTGRALAAMRELACIKEGLFLSTCNRVEAILTTEEASEAKRSVIALLCRIGDVREETLSSTLFVFEDMDAVRHIFRVASSLDSNRAFHVAKRVRTETGVSDAAVSVSYAAVELAKKIFHDLQGKRVLLVGAGEMAELAARHLLRQGVGSIRVANRTFHRAVQMAKIFQGSPVSYGEIGAQLLEVDIVISSTASPEYVITHEQVKGSLRKRRNRPLFFIDIAVPRDVEPGVNDLDNVYVYDIDDLKGVIQINVAQRQAEAVKAERIVEEEVIQFEKWLKTLEVVPTIISLKDKAESIRQVELRRSLTGLADLTPSQVEMIERLTLSITEKIINDPILVLKGKADRPTRDMYLDVARRLFKLDEDDEEEHGHGPP